MKKVAIIGAGITGLSTAYYLKDHDANIDIYEQTDRVGGKVNTYRQDGYTLELGPESYLSRKTIMTELAVDIGMESELVRNEVGLSFIYVNNKLSPLPKGTMLGVPTELWPFLKTDIVSPVGKLRAGLDLFKPVLKIDKDITAGDFFRRRLGDEVLENLIEPLLSGVYGTDIDKLSLMSTFPNFKQQEEQHGGLIKGMIKSKKSAPKKTSKQGMFFQFKNGLQSFIDRLNDAVIENGAHVHLNHTLESVKKLDEGYELTINGETNIYDEVIITTPHFSYKKWFTDAKLDYFKTMPATSVATVVFGFNEGDVVNEKEGTGFVVSRNQDTAITACTWTSKKWPHSTPDGKVVLRAYVGRPGDNIVKEKSEEDLAKAAMHDLRQIMTIKKEPEFTIVTPMVDSMPNYHLGHKDHVTELESYMEQEYPGLYLIGASHYAVGLPDCVKLAKLTAEKIMN
ncbi:protoporphyrinogen oxidase [Aliicoccus persicus]|uniref:Coproporphyrinogen III oxidase n=1 Tax=Aliicoccus persicus TaxID=930138 RepID=A0A662Z7M2_9STAP|nr:protoporphyrinogen oxidase [Aliicoccus persicus]SEW19487.1 oxygen-dependent protoporphyrinogen oxidase [Aliicoccus persicus]